MGRNLGRKALVLGISVVSLVACCGLAWWQWQRFSSANGSFQNLGYVLQWPLFGLAPAYMFWRLRRLRAQGAGRAEVAPPPPPRVPRPRPAPVQDADEDDELAAYNRYLARLNAENAENAEQENR